MKELIEYNYNIEIDELDEGEESSSFFHGNDLYLLVQFKRNTDDINDIIDCSKELKVKKILSFDIIQNKKGKSITNIDNIEYILLAITKNYKEKLDIIDIINYNKKTVINGEKKKSYKNNWGDLWSKKIDYYEYQISERGHDKKILKDSFSYFVGLAENAILICNKTNQNDEYGKNDLITLSHRRIFYPNYVLNYCNPISYIIDLSIRDVAEYIKACFYANDNAHLELDTFLKTVKLSSYSYQMLYARLLFPSLYFDCYERVLEHSDNEEDLIKIISKVDDFEYFLKDAYQLISRYSKIDKITWL